MISFWAFCSSIFLFFKLAAITIIWMLVAELCGYTNSTAPKLIARRRGMKSYRPGPFRRTSSSNSSPAVQRPTPTMYTVPIDALSVERPPVTPITTSSTTPSPRPKRDHITKTSEKSQSRSPSPIRRRDSILRMAAEHLTPRSPSPSAKGTTSPHRTRPSTRSRAQSNASTATSASGSSSGRSSSSRSSSTSRPRTPERKMAALTRSPEGKGKSKSRSRERDGEEKERREKNGERERKGAWRRERGMSTSVPMAAIPKSGHVVRAAA
ncbi:hypothetical protein M011DRAFT_90024 [Sporormia fimetaria CBS 119925]|uniref:Uncharacterized protein n=1 Tax=Sporormia fimetaria CBS 119925 TaxID=1340428 RepID=A0A6A6V6W6_9PLEO|nr:hypothetical protein M011DRAFT_90024 [Sporormia fimetaria CBS 119925]